MLYNYNIMHDAMNIKNNKGCVTRNLTQLASLSFKWEYKLKLFLGKITCFNDKEKK
jgi:hypothetical protein